MYFPVQGNPCLFFEHTVFNENSHKRKQLYGLLKSGGHVDTDAVQISPSLSTHLKFPNDSWNKSGEDSIYKLVRKALFLKN